VISGSDVALGTRTEEAIGEGLAWVHVVTGVVSVGCIMVAVSLARRTRALALAPSSVRDASE
jgi:hypothetical protein